MESENNEDDKTENGEETREENTDTDEKVVNKKAEEYMMRYVVEGTLDNPIIVSISPCKSESSEIENQELQK